MLFNSYPFIFVFLPLTLVAFFLLGKQKCFKAALVLLVFASLLFYAYWDVYYLPLLIFSISFNYYMAKKILASRSKNLLICGITIDLALLFYFKYTNFFIENINRVFHSSVFIPDIILPLGISFFTFTQMAYLIDAYRGETEEHSILTYSLFVTFFPHLIAGPILYHKAVIPQFLNQENFKFSYKNLALGINMFGMGLFKKVIIADNLAQWATVLFSNAGDATMLEAWAGALAYTLQLYFDFSGYSEMAVGIGLMMNINLPINFNSPYQSKSIIEFWRRWHITLSNFLKNYLYIPLGGNRHGQFRKMCNLLITMLLGGLWHGAGWTFIIWGALHGIYLVINHLWRKLQIELPNVLSWPITFIAVVVAWVFFRAHSVHDAMSIVKAMSGCNGIVLPSSLEGKLSMLKALGVNFGTIHSAPLHLLILSSLICILLYIKEPHQLLAGFSPNFKWVVVMTIILTASFFSLNKISEFLYFQF